MRNGAVADRPVIIYLSSPRNVRNGAVARAGFLGDQTPVHRQQQFGVDCSHGGDLQLKIDASQQNKQYFLKCSSLLYRVCCWPDMYRIIKP